MLACAVVSAGSIAAFVTLVNAGVVSLNVSQSSEPKQENTDSDGWGSVEQVSKGDAEEVLTLQEVAAKVTMHLPDEKSRRVGQSVAAASLPEA